MKKIQIITLFPEMFDGVLNTSMMLKAQNIGATSFEIIDLRIFGLGARRQVDDTPYGGGDGMLLMIEPLVEAIKTARENDPTTKVLITSPKGGTLNQTLAESMANDEGLTLICGHYEGFDARIWDYVDGAISLGNFVLTGGELASMVIIDSIVRLLPNVLGGEKSAEIESFSNGSDILEFPQYTRPAEFDGKKVPAILLSGHHANIEHWRKENSFKKEAIRK